MHNIVQAGIDLILLVLLSYLLHVIFLIASQDILNWNLLIVEHFQKFVLMLCYFILLYVQGLEQFSYNKFVVFAYLGYTYKVCPYILWTTTILQYWQISQHSLPIYYICQATLSPIAQLVPDISYSVLLQNLINLQNTDIKGN